MWVAKNEAGGPPGDPLLLSSGLSAERAQSLVEGWQAQVRAGEVEPVVRELLLKHYDPGYAASIARNFRHYGDARTIAPADRSQAAMAALARGLLA